MILELFYRLEGTWPIVFLRLLPLYFYFSVVTPLCSYAGYMVGTATLSHRLGGLYCLYCLYETQPFNPSFKVYLSLGMTIFHLKKQLCLIIQLLDNFCIVTLQFSLLIVCLYLSVWACAFIGLTSLIFYSLLATQVCFHVFNLLFICNLNTGIL